MSALWLYLLLVPPVVGLCMWARRGRQQEAAIARMQARYPQAGCGSLLPKLPGGGVDFPDIAPPPGDHVAAIAHRHVVISDRDGTRMVS